MTQYGYEPLSPDDSGSTLLERMNGVVPALLTNHKGAVRPGYVQPGMMWIDDSGATWLLNVYDGMSDVPIAAIDPETHAVVIAFATIAEAVAGEVTGKPVDPAGVAAAVAALSGWDLVVEDQRASGTSAGSAIVGWQTRTLNTVRRNAIAGASLAGNALSLPAGTYEAEYETVGHAVNYCKVGLYNASSAEYIAYGLNGYSSTSVTSFLRGNCRFALPATSEIQIRLYAGAAKTPDGLGTPASIGAPEVYSALRIKRLD
jgi:hypothetical protein